MQFRIQLDTRELVPGERTFYELGSGELLRVIIPSLLAPHVSMVHIYHDAETGCSSVSTPYPGLLFSEVSEPVALGNGEAHTLVVTNEHTASIEFSCTVYLERDSP